MRIKLKVEDRKQAKVKGAFEGREAEMLSWGVGAVRHDQWLCVMCVVVQRALK